MPFKTLEVFELLPEKDRIWAFKYLDNRSTEAFKLIPLKDRYKCFKYLDSKNMQEISLFPEKVNSEDVSEALKYLKTIDFEIFKLFPSE